MFHLQASPGSNCLMIPPATRGDLSRTVQKNPDTYVDQKGRGFKPSGVGIAGSSNLSWFFLPQPKNIKIRNMKCLLSFSVAP